MEFDSNINAMILNANNDVDPHGIVFSISEPLSAGNINLLYLSTFMTANVLVSGSFQSIRPFLHHNLLNSWARFRRKIWILRYRC